MRYITTMSCSFLAPTFFYVTCFPYLCLLSDHSYRMVFEAKTTSNTRCVQKLLFAPRINLHASFSGNGKRSQVLGCPKIVPYLISICSLTSTTKSYCAYPQELQEVQLKTGHREAAVPLLLTRKPIIANGLSLMVLGSSIAFSDR
ncbi:UNVERIFIED_CONTAM: hypothetical protein K2H54_026918 [Gekko kuhli]